MLSPISSCSLTTFGSALDFFKTFSIISSVSNGVKHRETYKTKGIHEFKILSEKCYLYHQVVLQLTQISTIKVVSLHSVSLPVTNFIYLIIAVKLFDIYLIRPLFHQFFVIKNFFLRQWHILLLHLAVSPNLGKLLAPIITIKRWLSESTVAIVKVTI